MTTNATRRKKARETSLKAYLRSWAKPPRRLTLTRAGKFFMLLTLGVGAGALNTGNNLLFLLMGMMLSAIIASGILSEAVLRKLQPRRRLPARLYARTPALGAFRINNPKNYISLNIELSELNPKCVIGPLEDQEIGMKDISWWKFWIQDVYEDHRYVAIARTFELEANSQVDLSARYTFPERGQYELPGLRFSTRFPFGLFHKVAEHDDMDDVIVYPEIIDAEDWVAEVAARFGDMKRNRAGVGAEYFGLRDWRTGEDRRLIHWKASAKRDNLVVREFEDEEQRAVQVVFVPSAGGAVINDRLKQKFELGLSKTVGLIQSLQAQRYRVGLSLPDLTIEPNDGHTQLDRMLRALALTSLRFKVSGTYTIPGVLPGARKNAQMATIGVGFANALAQSGLAFDMTIALEEDPASEL